MNKDKLLALIASKTEARNALIAKKTEYRTKIETADDVELRSIIAQADGITTQIEAIDTDITELRSYVAEVEAFEQSQSRFNPLGTYGGGAGGGTPENRSADPFDTPEYRNAFLGYVQTGTMAAEFRANATTMTSDIGSIIPTTIVNNIVEKMEAYGEIWARVTKTNYQGGVEIPTSSLKPKASWVAEGTVSDKNKKTTGSVIFAFHKLQIRVAVSLEASVTSLAAFEQNISNNIAEAMIIALEEAIIVGTGVGQPLGILVDETVTNTVEITVANIKKYDAWVAALAKIKLAYRGKGVLVMTAIDWDTNIVGMVDTAGQPIARVTYGLDGKPVQRFLGYEVVLVDKALDDFATASTGDTFAFFADLSKYTVNSNLQMMYKRYFDENTDEWISKNTMIADGKLSDPNGVLLIKKR